jgi:hypothetical protein
MYRRTNTGHIFLLIALLAVLSSYVIGQSRQTSDSTGSSDNIHSLYAGAGGGSNMIYLGSTLSGNKPFYAASLSYGYRNSLFVSASATHLSGMYPYAAFYNAGINYSHAFNSWFDISADIAGYKAASSLRDSLFYDFMYLNLTTGFDWKLIYTRVSFSEVVSQRQEFYLMISNSHYFETPPFMKGKAQISFNPDIDILFANLVSVDSVAGTKTYGNPPPFSHAKKKTTPGSESYSEKFGLMDLEFSLPVTLSLGRLSVELQPGWLLPIHSTPVYQEPEGFIFYLNIFYKIL